MESNNKLEQNYYGDEIDLIELLGSLWDGRWVVGGVALVTVLLAGIYAFMTPEVYKVDAIIGKPFAAQLSPIQPTNGATAQTQAVQPVSPAEVFELVKGFILSQSLQGEVWARHRGVPVQSLESDPEISGELEAMLDKLEITLPKKSDEVGISISLKTTEPQADYQFVSDLLLEADKRVISSVSERLVKALLVQRSNLGQQIERLRASHQVEIEDSITQYREALVIASKMGITETPFEQLENIELRLVDDKLYLLGTKALEAQIEALDKRKGDDAFIPGLRELQNRVELMIDDASRIANRFDEASSFVVLKPVTPPLKPERSKKLLILIGAVVGGGFLGVMVLIFVNVMKAIRKRAVQI